MKHPSSSATLQNNMGKATTIRQFVYSSQMKNRENYTLKNMLGIEQNEPLRNFQSQQSQRMFRSNSRPNTMYGQRVRGFLQDENKKQKMQTQIKIKRHQSAYRMKGVGETKTVTTDQKLKMKKALGKINLLAEGVDVGVSEQEEIEAIFYFLECLSEINNHYQQAFVYIAKRLKQLVFADKSSQFGRTIKRYVEKNKNNELLFNFVYRSLGKISYQSLANELSYEIHKILQQFDQFRLQEEKGGQNYELIVKEKQNLIKKLKNQLKYYQQHPSQDLYPYIKKLQSNKGQMEEEIDELVKIKDDNQYRLQIYDNTNLLLSEQIQSLKDKIYQFQLEELSGMKEVEKNSQLKEFQNNVSNLKGMLDKSKLKMEGMKEQFQKMRIFNEELINQRSKLAKRAAVGFGELTPRPKIKQIFTDNNLQFEKYFPPTKNQRSTEQVVKKIVKTFKKSSSQNIDKGMQENKEKISEIGNDVINDAFEYIEETKTQVNKTLQAAQQVKKSFNKQKKQREELQKLKNKNN